jgi:hypothetical protein
MVNGDKYTGEFAHNNIDGYGIYEHASYVDLSRAIVPGARYEGSFKRGKRHGQGMYVMRNGDVYSGWFADDLFEGEGCLKLQQGGSITGNFHKGKPSGKCNVIYANGDTYEGDMLAGEPDGTALCAYVSHIQICLIRNHRITHEQVKASLPIAGAQWARMRVAGGGVYSTAMAVECM